MHAYPCENVEGYSENLPSWTYMCTEFGKQKVQHNSMLPFVSELGEHTCVSKGRSSCYLFTYAQDMHVYAPNHNCYC